MTTRPILHASSAPETTLVLDLLDANWNPGLVDHCYLISLAAVGIVAGRRVKDTGQYVLGKRRFGNILMMAQSFGVGTHADMAVSLAGAAYTQDISA
jgi:Na+/proline symporter